MVRILQERGYTSDPVKAWKEAMQSPEQPDEGSSGDEREEEETSKGPDYNYLMGMPMWNLIWETAEELLNNRDKKVRERGREREREREREATLARKAMSEDSEFFKKFIYSI